MPIVHASSALSCDVCTEIFIKITETNIKRKAEDVTQAKFYKQLIDDDDKQLYKNSVL